MAIDVKSGDLLTTEELGQHLAIYAGPGAGKTHFLVNNVKRIVESNPKISQSSARKILCITYTNAAVDEIAKRLDGYTDSVEVCTIHNFILKYIIAPFQEDLRRIMKKDFEITITRKAKITAQIEGLSVLHGYDKETINEDLSVSIGPHDEYGKKILSEVQIDTKLFTNCGQHGFQHSPKIKEQHIKAIKQYIWNNIGKLTFDEILYFGFRMLQENSTIAYALRVKFPFVFIDEFQDTNPLQTKIAQYLGIKSTVVGVIGDAAQSIYSFQGAHPSDFLGFNISGERKLSTYQIVGNRRSTSNIVNFCNYIRRVDGLQQKSVKKYKDATDQQECENKPIHFLCGETPETLQIINDLVGKGAVVLTRIWADAFAYIQNISDDQREQLKKIYNSYFKTSIDIRSDIMEHSRVVWVRAFRFMLMLYSAYQHGSFVDMLNAFSLYIKEKELKQEGVFTASAILKIRNLLTTIFQGLTDDTLICSIINDFNATLSQEEYKDIRNNILQNEAFAISYISDLDEDIRPALEKIEWNTAKRLFEDVFSKDAQYMTVHQGKGQEWDTVVVATIPTVRRDGTDLETTLTNPNILGEDKIAEFVRIFYVACSRARQDLYIHLPAGVAIKGKIAQSLDIYKEATGCRLDYEFID